MLGDFSTRDTDVSHVNLGLEFAAPLLSSSNFILTE